MKRRLLNLEPFLPLLSPEEVAQDTWTPILSLSTWWWSWTLVTKLFTLTGAFTGPSLNHGCWISIQLMVRQGGSWRRSNIRWKWVWSAAAANRNHNSFSWLDLQKKKGKQILHELCINDIEKLQNQRKRKAMWILPVSLKCLYCGKLEKETKTRP